MSSRGNELRLCCPSRLSICSQGKDEGSNCGQPATRWASLGLIPASYGHEPFGSYIADSFVFYVYHADFIGRFLLKAAAKSFIAHTNPVLGMGRSAMRSWCCEIRNTDTESPYCTIQWGTHGRAIKSNLNACRLVSALQIYASMIAYSRF